MSTSSLAIDISRVNEDQQITVEDYVAVEEPLEIQIGATSAADAAAKSISITMRTPGHDVDLALGFLCTEAVIKSASQVEAAELVGPADEVTGLRNIVRVELKADVEIDLGRLQRHFYTTSSCGVCGKSSIDALRITGCDSLKDKGASYPRQLILSLPDKLLQQQQLFSQTGGLHAAAIFDDRGEIVCVREDVGRHNAVDKVIGALLLGDMLPATKLGLLVSGRASFELVQKALVAGLPILAAVSAPSSLAVALANEFGMTLLGFLRGSRFNIYAGENRITEQHLERI
jgi:FdhD protein